MRRVTCICCFVLFWADLTLAQSTEKSREAGGTLEPCALQAAAIRQDGSVHPAFQP